MLVLMQHEPVEPNHIDPRRYEFFFPDRVMEIETTGRGTQEDSMFLGLIESCCPGRQVSIGRGRWIRVLSMNDRDIVALQALQSMIADGRRRIEETDARYQLRQQGRTR